MSDTKYASDPCGHGPDDSPVPSLHTYTVHLALRAGSDLEAAKLAEKIHDLITDYHAAAEDGSEFRDGGIEGYPLDSVFVTDADDWSEHIDNEALCADCGVTTDRSRVGNGKRVCPACIEESGATPYPIMDVIW